MQVVVNGQQFNLDSAPFARGGEGELYDLSKAEVAKLYYTHLRTDERRQKVLALCNSYANFSKRHSEHLIAFPEFPAYEAAVSFDSVVGFSMQRYDFPKIGELGFDIEARRFRDVSGFKFDDRSAISFVYDLFALMDQLHQARIVLGDVNPENFMCDPATHKPVILDVDAAQIGGFPCWSTHEHYNDPQLRTRGKGITGAFTFDFGTDIFALAIVCFEFLVGTRPHRVLVTPPKQDKQLKTIGVSCLMCLALGRDSVSQLGVRYFPCPENDAIEQRVLQIKALDPRLYEFFVAVFVREERENVLFSLPLNDHRHPANLFFVSSGMDEVIRIEKEKRRQRESVLARQGQRRMPDSGFAEVIGSVSAARAGVAAPKAKAPVARTDPAALRLFFDQFNLRIGT